MKAIQTKYLPPTNTLGARVKAFDGDGNQVTISHYQHELEEYEIHEKAAKMLMEKLGWDGKIAGGWLKDGMAFVFI
jgi:hypothetical protein